MVLNFKDEPLVCCRLCLFSIGEGGTYGRNFIYLSSLPKLLARPPCVPIGSLDEILFPIGPLSQLQNEFLA